LECLDEANNIDLDLYSHEETSGRDRSFGNEFIAGVTAERLLRPESRTPTQLLDDPGKKELLKVTSEQPSWSGWGRSSPSHHQTRLYHQINWILIELRKQGMFDTNADVDVTEKLLLHVDHLKIYIELIPTGNNEAIICAIDSGGMKLIVAHIVPGGSIQSPWGLLLHLTYDFGVSNAPLRDGDAVALTNCTLPFSGESVPSLSLQSTATIISHTRTLPWSGLQGNTTATGLSTAKNDANRSACLHETLTCATSNAHVVKGKQDLILCAFLTLSCRNGTAWVLLTRVGTGAKASRESRTYGSDSRLSLTAPMLPNNPELGATSGSRPWRSA
jgi:hypothetical protein